ncbi:helix-turn-helix transcriptional regulator [Nonomuraea sp. NPDC050022]|uniref:helix-turn-helix transcriptional regulator n=1 Tax=Nonomuraea sp. NPDC050022 TaxID=3364358 RepID=UPI00379B0D9B
MIGRHAEIALLREMIAESGAGQGNAIVVYGQAGIGKSALLAEIARTAGGDPLVLRVTGVEAEAELPFAALHMLLGPARQLITELPAAQRDALRGAFGQSEGGAQDRFLVGLAVLTLLADLAGERPLLCLVDDVQWLDRASVDALVFAARRLGAERITMILAARDDGTERPVDGVPELRLAGLARPDCEALLAEVAADLVPEARDRVIEEAEGNPLALLEFAGTLTPEQRAGRLSPLPLQPPRLSLAGRLEQSLRAAIRLLPERTQRLLLIAAAEDTGDLDLVLRAAQSFEAAEGFGAGAAEGFGPRMAEGSGGRAAGFGAAAAVGFGAGLADLEPAERRQLVRVSEDRLRFRHPLVKTAAYREAPLAHRVAAHHALARVLDGDEQADRRAWHLSAAAVGPDEETSAVLAATGDRARQRGSHASAATAYERAAQLTVDRRLRAQWLAAAAEAAIGTGQLARAGAAADRGRRLTGDPAVLARLAAVRAAVDAEHGGPTPAAHTLIEAAAGIAGNAPDDAASLLATAAGEAWFAGDRAALGQITELLAALGPGIDDSLATVAGAVRGMERVAAGDPAAGLPLLRAAIVPLRASLPTPAAGRVIGTYAVFSALMTGDDDAACEMAAAQVDTYREQGLIGALPHALQLLTQAQILHGRHAEAAASGAEAWQIAHDTGQAGRLRHLHGILARLAAIEGDDERCVRLAQQAEGAAQERNGSGWGGCALTLLDLVRARHEAVAERMARVLDGPLGHTVIVTFAIADYVEACARLGEPSLATEAFARFDAWAAASAQPWAAAVAYRCRALLAPPGEAEAHYTAALQRHAQGGRPFERARTELLYGEWLRRGRRRSDAGVRLRAAMDRFAALGATPWAERARTELAATGARADLPEPGGQARPLDTLTPQELQVVRLAATGATNRQIAAQLFLSPRTVGFHLYKAYPKLGVSSRTDLAGIDLGWPA